MEEMLRWYLKVTQGRIVFQNLQASFLTWDSEHHRLGFVTLSQAGPQNKTAGGVEHIGLTYASLKELLDVYVELRDLGVVPIYCTNHGPSTSFYYEDPDGNHVELLIDNFSNSEDADRFVESEAFRANPMGLNIDPERLLRGAREGIPVSRLTAYEALP